MTDGKEKHRYLTFVLGDSHYALPLLQVKEVIEMTEVTPIPQAPSHFKGLLNLRGQVITVLDLRAKFKLAAAEQSPKSAIVILDLQNGMNLGFVVDRVEGVIEFRKEDIGPPPEMLGDRPTTLTGVARTKETLILIIDVARALNLDEIKILAENKAA